ncbi:MAG: hypothetical protein AAF989_04035 [Planctomycetota bacterium]
MNHRNTARLALVLLLASIVPLSLAALAQSDDLADHIQEPAFPRDTSEPPQSDIGEDLPGDDDLDPEYGRGSEFDEGTREVWEAEFPDNEEWAEEEDDDVDDEDGEHELHQPFEHAQQLGALADDRAAAFAYATHLLIECAGEEQASVALKGMLATTEDPESRRLIAIRLAELYAELDQPSEIEQLLVELSR